MKKPVQVAGALITGGLLFGPAHAEAQAAGAFGVTAAELSISTFQLHEVRSAADEPAAQRLRVLAEYVADDATVETADDDAQADEDESGDTSETDDSSGTGDSTGKEETSGNGETSGNEDTSGTGGSAAEPFGSTIEPSDAVNEVPVTRQPKRTTYEQGATASEAAGRDSALKFKFSTGFDYSSGKYGADSDTTILYIPVSGQLETRSWKFKVTIPWIRIKGPAGVLPGEGGGQVGEAGPVIENSGLGDIVASATYKLPPLGEGLPFIDLTAKVKFPTADEEKFLGTGAYDFTAQADIFQALGDLTLFGSIGYRVVGDPKLPLCFDALLNPIQCDLNNGFVASGGFSYKFNDRLSGGGILDWREASLDTAEDPFEIVPYLVWKVHPDWSLQAYGVFGLSDGSPDAGGGMQIVFTLD